MAQPTDSLPNASDMTRAVTSVLLELADILGDYRDALVVSGGLAMHLLFGSAASAAAEPGQGGDEPFFARVTKDVDVVLNLLVLARDFDDQDATIGELLTQNLYQQETRRQFWVKSVRLPGFANPVEVPVEFLAPAPGDTSTDASLLTRVAEQQEIQPAALGGLSLALLQPRRVLLGGYAPDGTYRTDIPIRVVDPAMLILIKAIAFAERLEKQERAPAEDRHRDHAAKHAYDISQLLQRYPGGVSALAERLIPPYITAAGPEQPTIDDALESLRAHFSDRAGQGVRLMIAEGEYRTNAEEAELAQQGTVARVKRLLRRLDEHGERVL